MINAISTFWLLQAFCLRRFSVTVIHFIFGQPKKIRGPLQWLLGEGLEAMLISLHFDPVFYLEARMSAGLTLDKRELITRMRDRMNEIPDQIQKVTL